MTWSLVARKEFVDGVRSKTLWALLAVSTVAVLGIALTTAVQWQGSVGDSLVTNYLVLLGLFGGLVVFPILALVSGYLAVAGERESGSIRLLHGLPHSRGDIVVGKFLGRAALVGSALAVTLLLSGLAGKFWFGAVPVESFAVFGLFTLTLAVAFTAIAVGVSAFAASRARAMAGAVGSYSVFAVGWQPLVSGVYYLVTGSLPGLRAPAWYLLLERLSPLVAYRAGVNGLLGFENPRLQSVNPLPVRFERIPPSQVTEYVSGSITLADRLGGPVPFYLEPWFAAVLLGLWVVFPLLVGYWRFRGADLA